MKTRSDVRAAVTLVVAACLGVAGAVSQAEPLQDTSGGSPPVAVDTVKPVSVAQREFDEAQVSYRAGVSSIAEFEHARSALTIARAAAEAEQVEARYRAGIASNVEVQQAKSGLAIIQAQVRLQESQAAYQRQDRMYKAGLIPDFDVAAAHLEVAANELAFYQAQADARKIVADNRRQMFRLGLGTSKDAEDATTALHVADAALVEQQAKFTVEKLAFLKANLTRAQVSYKAGVSPKSDVDAAQAAYDAFAPPH